MVEVLVSLCVSCFHPSDTQGSFRYHFQIQKKKRHFISTLFFDPLFFRQRVRSVLLLNFQVLCFNKLPPAVLSGKTSYFPPAQLVSTTFLKDCFVDSQSRVAFLFGLHTQKDTQVKKKITK